MKRLNILKTIILGSSLWMSTVAVAQTKDPFYLGLNLGYTYGQYYVLEDTNGVYGNLIYSKDASGGAYGLDFGYYLTDSHRLKIGLTGMKANAKSLRKGWDNVESRITYLHFDYDFIVPLSQDFNLTVGANLGYMKHKSGVKDRENTYILNGLAYGYQIGGELTLDPIVLGLEFRTIHHNQTTIVVDEGSGDSADSISPIHYLINFMIGFRF